MLARCVCRKHGVIMLAQYVYRKHIWPYASLICVWKTNRIAMLARYVYRKHMGALC